MFIFVFRFVPGNDHNRVMIRPQIMTGQRSEPDLVLIMISFFSPFFWLLNIIATQVASSEKFVVCFCLICHKIKYLLLL